MLNLRLTTKVIDWKKRKEKKTVRIFLTFGIS